MHKKIVSGFTIVELLIVIVVIGVLAAITIVSYGGITQKANEAIIMSDLGNAAKQLKLFQVENGNFPVTNDCGAADSATNKCLRSSAGNTYGSIQSSNLANLQSFCIDLTKNNATYSITNDSAPVVGSCPILTRVTVGNGRSCAIASNNDAYCWGFNSHGEIGDNSTGVNKLVPTAVSTAGVLAGLSIKSISTGTYHTCAIASNDNAYCWGYNLNGQIGDGTSGIDRLVPVAVIKSGALAGLTIKSIATGNLNTCAIASDGYAYCWGKNDSGQVGDGTSGTDRLSPVAVDRTGVLAGLKIKSISVGSYSTCAIASDNNAYCWGQNVFGELGDGTGTGKTSPVAVSKSGVLSSLTVKSISNGTNHSCVIASDNNAYCWGLNMNGQIGDNSFGTNRLSPVAVNKSGVFSALTVKSISAGGTYTCSIASDDNAYCWGYDAYGQIGDNSSGTDRLVPTTVYKTGALNGLTVKYIATGYNNACVIASDSKVYCWGHNGNGQIGDSTSGNSRLVPTAVVSLP